MLSAPSFQYGISTVARVAALALTLLIVKTVELILTHDFMGAIETGAMNKQAWFALAVMLAAFSMAIVGSFTTIIRGHSLYLAATVVSALLATTAGMEASSLVSKLAPMYRFTSHAVMQTGMTFTLVYMLCQAINISGTIRKWPPLIAAAIVAMVGIFGVASSGWQPVDLVEPWLFFFRDAAIVTAPILILGYCTFSRSLRIDPRNKWNSLLLRLPSRSRNGIWFASFIMISSGGLFGLIWQVFAMTIGTAGQFAAVSFGILCLPWFGTAWLNMGDLAGYLMQQRQSVLTARLTDRQAKRFIKRHHRDSTNWAATVGLRTANFTIDHDPGSALHSLLPASLLHIRAEEIQRCVTMVLGEYRLHSNTMDHRIFGAMDPETSHRSCVDTLKLFACLYLDASPLVERRIKGLTSLLPIIDPSLAKMLNPNEISHMIRRNQWFFHFDFDWIDQHVIHTPNSTRYDVMVSTLSSSTRQAMMEQIQGRGGIGNFVWMGPDARDRVMQEAPVLKNIVEACPISLNGGTDERLMFIIKFEQLIPRLQRYFNLDRWRKTLMDFDPTPENERLSNLLALQANRANSIESVSDLLDSIASIAWQGFREKDGALQLVLQTYNNINEQLGLKDALHTVKDSGYVRLHQKMLDTVQRIGYPSQILHHAQITKRTLRQIDNLLFTASKPTNSRFFEAWLFLSTADFTRNTPGERRQILEFLLASCANDRMWDFLSTSFKAIDALANVGKVCETADERLIQQVLNMLALRLVKNKVPSDAICLLMDTLTHLDGYMATPASFSSEATAALGTYLHLLQDELGPNHPDVTAVMSRWQEFNVQNAAA